MLPYPKLLVCIVQGSSLFPFKNLLVNISAFPVAAGKLPLPSLNLDVLFGQWTRTFILRFRASVTSLWERQTGDYKTVTLTGDMESSLLKANPSHAHELREVPSKKNLCNELIKNVSYQVCFEQLQKEGICRSPYFLFHFPVAFLCLFYKKFHPVSFQFDEPLKNPSLFVYVYKIT